MMWTYSGAAHLLALSAATLLLSSAAGAAELGVTLACDQTTERGFDEVFVVVSGKSSAGQEIVARAPAERNFFRLSAGAAHQFSLADTVIKEGETVRLVVALFEDDDGPGASWQSLASSMLHGIPPSLADVPGPLLQTFRALDEFRPRYDFLGAFSVTLTRAPGGSVEATWAALDDAEALPPSEDDKRAHLFRFAGDGGAYSLSATINPVDREEPLLSAR